MKIIKTYKELIDYLTEGGIDIDSHWMHMIFRRKIEYPDPTLNEYYYGIKEVLWGPSQNKDRKGEIDAGWTEDFMPIDFSIDYDEAEADPDLYVEKFKEQFRFFRLALASPMVDEDALDADWTEYEKN